MREGGNKKAAAWVDSSNLQSEQKVTLTLFNFSLKCRIRHKYWSVCMSNDFYHHIIKMLYRRTVSVHPSNSFYMNSHLNQHHISFLLFYTCQLSLETSQTK